MIFGKKIKLLNQHDFVADIQTPSTVMISLVFS
jgi:hypothetical protein